MAKYIEAYWPVVDGTGTDYSGNNRTLSRSTTGSSWLTGKGIRKGCLEFTTISGWARFASLFTPNDSTRIFLNFWCKAALQSNSYYLCSHGEPGFLRNFVLRRQANADTLQILVNNEAGTMWVTVNVNNYFTGYDNKYVMVSIDIDTTANTIKVYRNGVWFSSSTLVTHGIAPMAASLFYIGYSSGYSFIGQVCEVLYTSGWEITNAQILNLYLQQKGYLYE